MKSCLQFIEVGTMNFRRQSEAVTMRELECKNDGQQATGTINHAIKQVVGKGTICLLF